MEGGNAMRRATVIGVTLLGIAAAVLIAVGAYHAGSHQAVVQTTTEGGQVVHVVGPGYYGHWGWGFFPGFLLFPLLIFGFFFLMRGLFWGRRWGGPGGPGGYGGSSGWQERSKAFEDWHRRQHEQSAGDHTSAGGEPS
jgi:hypothetical protein